MRTSITRNITICILLFGLCVLFRIVFNKITPDYFTGTGNLHIIDIHVQECGLKGLFDGPYIATARPYYKPDVYKHTFLILDTIFPVVYSLFIFSLGYAFHDRIWYRVLMLFIIAGALFDYGEDYCFLYYLSHPSTVLADRIAFCTSMKSLLLLFNFISGLVLFIAGLLRRKYTRNTQ